jgi:hypothetical protein
MEVTPKEARELLGQTDAIAEVMRNHLMYRRIGPVLILWGIIWIICFPLTGLLPAYSGWIWLIGDCIGFVGSGLNARRCASPIRSASSSFMRSRILWFWVVLLAYGCLWMFLIHPAGNSRSVLFIVTLIMFAYVAMGLLARINFMTWLGVGVTILAMVGYGLFANKPLVLNVWMGITGGLALLATGIFLHLRAR